MKRTIFGKRLRICAAISIGFVSAALLTGCGSEDTGMVDADAVAVESDADIIGSWVAPGRDFSITFSEDGTFAEKEKLSTVEGTWQFMSQNMSFAIADQFDEVHYISCVDEDEDAVFTGAVLGDLISGYNETQKMERFYVRQGREAVPQEELVGSWEDANSNSYYAILNEDGTLKTTDWEGTWEILENEEYGTEVIFHFEDYDEEYAAIRYEKFLFLYRDGTSNVYQLQPMEEDVE
ncbi:MAG: hypothetical protein Q4B03_05580 [Lachnospiraceae bacterium]|nr:hypothetical protein [Lachnospiraceae bacterium]